MLFKFYRSLLLLFGSEEWIPSHHLLLIQILRLSVWVRIPLKKKKRPLILIFICIFSFSFIHYELECRCTCTFGTHALTHTMSLTSCLLRGMINEDFWGWFGWQEEQMKGFQFSEVLAELGLLFLFDMMNESGMNTVEPITFTDQRPNSEEIFIVHD